MTLVMIQVSMFVVVDLLLVLLPFSMRMVIDSKLRDKMKKRMVYLIVILECLTLLGLAGLSLSNMVIVIVESIPSILNLCLIGIGILSILLAAIPTNMVIGMTKKIFI